MLEQLKKQENELIHYCIESKLEVVGIYTDVSVDTIFDRLKFTHLYSDLKHGRIKADLLLFTQTEIIDPNPFEVAIVHYNLLEVGITMKAIRDVNLHFLIIKPKGK
jgi:hypothetical protein